jgi:ribosomal protein S15P/S13E
MPKKTAKKLEKNSKKTSKHKKIPQEEFEKIVISLAEKGLTSEKIGEELKQQGIHSKEYNKKILRILKENDKYINPDLKNIEEKLERVKKHSEKNKQDKRAKREKDRIFAQLRKLKKYFKIPVK